MPIINHFTSIMIVNINDNNEYEYYYYDLDEGKIIKKVDEFENILQNYKNYLIVYRHLKQ